MKTGKNKISVRQLLFILTIIVSSPTTRFLPKYAAAKANQAGWLSPIVSIVPFIMLILIIDSLAKKYEGQSMSEIIINLLGKYFGKLVLVLYLLFTVLIATLYLRYYAERLTSSIYPNISNNLMVILILILIAYVIRSGFTVIARMGEVLLPFVGTILIILLIFLLPKVRADNVLPVYFNDIVPIIKGSFSSTAVLSYLFLLFFLSDKLVNLKSFKKFAYLAAFINISSIAAVIFTTIGVLGSSTAKRAPMPVLITVKQVSLMDTIENIESIIIAVWIFADFTLVSTMLVISLNLIKSIFKLSDTKPLINILAVLMYFLAMGVGSNKFELEDFSNTLFLPISFVMGYGFPIVLFALSKLKKGNKISTKSN